MADRKRLFSAGVCWRLTLTPLHAHDNYVSVIDVAVRKEVKKIPVGQVPKRNITANLVVGG